MKVKLYLRVNIWLPPWSLMRNATGIAGASIPILVGAGIANGKTGGGGYSKIVNEGANVKINKIATPTFSGVARK